MEKQLGSCKEMERRAQVGGAHLQHLYPCDSVMFTPLRCVFQARVTRIQQIEKDILRLGVRLQATSPVRTAHLHLVSVSHLLSCPHCVCSLQADAAQGPSDSGGLSGAQVSNLSPATCHWHLFFFGFKTVALPAERRPPIGPRASQ